VGKVLLILIAICLFSSLEAAENDNQAGLNYWNGLSKDAVTTSSGLQYKALITGTGRKPKSNSKVTVHYRGLLLNGVTFDSSYDDEEPVSLGLRSVIKGWIEGLQLMPVGSVFVFMIPPELAYGDSSSGAIPPNATLIFEIELFGVK
jgi:FKBP-type peptidyl-prolyl cis-trans isomerase